MAMVAARSQRLLRSLPPMDFAGRMERLRSALGEVDCEALLVTKVVNVRYLTGFTGSAALLLVRARTADLVTDGRYEVQAKGELAQAGCAAEVRTAPGASQQELLADLVEGLSSVGVEAGHVSWEYQRRLKKSWARGRRLVPTSGLVEALRCRKDTGEIARIAAAAAIADEALYALVGSAALPVTEVELAGRLDAMVRDLGAEAPAFETIVASGPNGAQPHHSPSPRRLRKGELVVIDFGARVDGYRSDMTRTLIAGAFDGQSTFNGPRSRGRTPRELRRAASVVLASQDAGLAAVRAGAKASEVDRACREVVEAAGFGELFVHGTGHGVGLEVHEAPALGEPSADILSSRQVVTVEPGVYIPGVGGARTEDTVRVTEAGCEVLTLAPKQSL